MILAVNPISVVLQKIFCYFNATETVNVSQRFFTRMTSHAAVSLKTALTASHVGNV